MNIVALVGHLATDPELRHTAAGKPVCTFRIAISRSAPNEADFFTVVAWERQAEVCSEYLTVGRRVAIDGRLHHATWEVEGAEGADKQRRSKVEVIAHRVELLDGPRRDRQAADDEQVAAAEAAPPTPDFALA